MVALNLAEKLLFALPEVVNEQSVGEVGKFVTFWSQVSSGYCISEFIKIGRFSRINSKNTMSTFLRHTVPVYLSSEHTTCYSIIIILIPFFSQ